MAQRGALKREHAVPGAFHAYGQQLVRISALQCIGIVATPRQRHPRLARSRTARACLECRRRLTLNGGISSLWRMGDPTQVPGREAFFASRSGVCVYVTVGRHAVRVCFESLDAEGRLEGSDPDGVGERALAAANEAFKAYRATLAPLFEQIAEASQTEAS
jgi:hypothetical protein